MEVHRAGLGGASENPADSTEGTLLVFRQVDLDGGANSKLAAERNNGHEGQEDLLHGCDEMWSRKGRGWLVSKQLPWRRCCNSACYCCLLVSFRGRGRVEDLIYTGDSPGIWPCTSSSLSCPWAGTRLEPLPAASYWGEPRHPKPVAARARSRSRSELGSRSSKVGYITAITGSRSHEACRVQ